MFVCREREKVKKEVREGINVHLFFVVLRFLSFFFFGFGPSPTKPMSHHLFCFRLIFYISN